ncbi:MAG: 6-phosphofructokinase [Clostridiales bacterium]|nr:6-phosphofructokinase [Clostridiales bacterium]
MKKIAVMTSGGDAPGMNACIRSVVKIGSYLNLQVYGINNGFRGLVEDDIIELKFENVSDIIQRGGTILGSARFPQFADTKYQDIAVENLKKRDISGVIVIGGDGSFTGAQKLSHRCQIPEHAYKCNVIGIPATIDNDIRCTDFTIGFDTALNTAIDAIDKIRDTMSSHDRCCVVEIMGNNCGYLTLYSGICDGAENIIIPESRDDYSVDALCKSIQRGIERKKRSHIIVIAEKMVDVSALAAELESRTGMVTRASILGHIQRGGAPSASDRMLATRMGALAVELLDKDISNKVIITENNKLSYEDIDTALAKTRNIDPSLIDLAKKLAL